MNQNQDVDYTDLVIADMCDILMSHKNPWPKNFTKLKKLEFLDKIILYLTETQQYELCANIVAMKERILDESIGKLTSD